MDALRGDASRGRWLAAVARAALSTKAAEDRL